MRILILGGTRFAGRFFTLASRDAGHAVTLFNRGESEPGDIPGVEQLTGDRDCGLGPLEGREWDAVVDFCGFFPRVVRQSVDLLASNAGHYTFVSSMSVYSDETSPGGNEDSALATLADPTVEEITGETYGGLKVLCEEEVRRGFPDRSLVIRPGLIVGPYDRSDRFTYWVRRIARGGEVLVPEPLDRAVQVIDARDLAEWMLRLVESAHTGTYNAVGPEPPHTMGLLVKTCREVAGSDASFTWVPERFLLDLGVVPWSDLPVVWMPEDEAFGAFRADISRPVAAGLTFRPLEVTVGDTLEWDRSRPQDEPMKAGLTEARERELLEAWRTRANQSVDEPGS
jgi:2'-hydroxyisoflavone reductase